MSTDFLMCGSFDRLDGDCKNIVPFNETQRARMVDIRTQDKLGQFQIVDIQKDKYCPLKVLYDESISHADQSKVTMF